MVFRKGFTRDNLESKCGNGGCAEKSAHFPVAVHFCTRDGMVSAWNSQPFGYEVDCNVLIKAGALSAFVADSSAFATSFGGLGISEPAVLDPGDLSFF